MEYYKTFKKFFAAFLTMAMALSMLSSGVSALHEDGRKRGLPLPAGVTMPARVMQPNGDPGDGDDLHPDWNGNFRIYYFQAPEDWLEHTEYKEKGVEIGFYWYYGTESGATWPGVPAKRLPGTENIYYAFAPSYANNIIWNNGIDGGYRGLPDFDQNKKMPANKQAILMWRTDFLISFPLMICAVACVFLKRTQSRTTTTPYMVDGNPVKDDNGFPMNPYYDMDYIYLPGDINTDGRCSLEDVLLIQKHLASSVMLTPAQQIAADVNQDGNISIFDAILVQKIIAKVA